MYTDLSVEMRQMFFFLLFFLSERQKSFTFIVTRVQSLKLVLTLTALWLITYMTLLSSINRLLIVLLSDCDLFIKICESVIQFYNECHIL